MGDIGGPADGFDQVLADLAGIVDSLGPVIDQQDQALDAALTALAAADPAPVDNSFNDYVGTFADGVAVVTSAHALAAPTVGPLPTTWFSPNTAPIVPPPTGGQVPGQITVGDKPFVYPFKFTVKAVNPDTGTQDVVMLNPNAVLTGIASWTKGPVYRIQGGPNPGITAQDLVININVDPVQAGTFEVFFRIDVGEPLPAGHGVGVTVNPKP